MSVAFRRESDDEHLEPKFEIPIPPGPNLVTARGRHLIDKRVAALEALLEQGGDETTINAAKRDLRYWQTRQITAELAPVPDGTTVEFGTTVSFRLDGKLRTVTIVGHDEADPAEGLIAFTAPLSRALIGAEPGEILAFGNREDAIEVVTVAAA
ncbi:GreA/GreB family elongation factor [Novosphingobium rhizovicinum]|uniref:GreA/GreB family elongation factor n=1 Tax=Novosphingobium rhizovicinum TaxID=3228928 RepID=A0ABV3RAM0_9SPHN